MKLHIPLTKIQAKTLVELMASREAADKAVVLYTAAIIGGTDTPEGGVFLGVQPAVNGTPAMLVLERPDAS